MQKTSPRFDILAAAKGWSPVSTGTPANGSTPRVTMDVEKIFGENTFGMSEMRARLPKPVFKALVATIEQGTELESIAAITFSEKAAAELRHRLRQRLISGDHRAALEVLDRAPIGTLHAFARRLLFEFPVEAGLPPGFDPHRS